MGTLGETQPLETTNPGTDTVDDGLKAISLPTDHEEGDEEASSRRPMCLGLLFSSIAGLCLAVLPMPSLYADRESAGLHFFLSFGVGCLIVVPFSGIMVVFTETNKNKNNEQSLLYRLVTFDDEIWCFKFKEVVVPAMSAGVVWGVGNIGGFCSFLYLSYTIAVSFVQCNVIVAMFLGIVLWKEMNTKIEIGFSFVLSLVLVGGCAVVVYGVFGSFA